MSLTAWRFFLPACFALNMTPEPNNLMSINVAARHGFMHALAGGRHVVQYTARRSQLPSQNERFLRQVRFCCYPISAPFVYVKISVKDWCTVGFMFFCPNALGLPRECPMP